MADRDEYFSQPASAIYIVEPGRSNADRVYELEAEGLSREDAVLQAAIEQVEFEELLGIEIDDEAIALSFDPNQPRDDIGRWTDAEVSYLSAPYTDINGEQRQVPTEEAQRRVQRLGLTSKTLVAAVGAPPGAKLKVRATRPQSDLTDGLYIDVDGEDDDAGGARELTGDKAYDSQVNRSHLAALGVSPGLHPGGLDRDDPGRPGGSAPKSSASLLSANSFTACAAPVTGV